MGKIVANEIMNPSQVKQLLYRSVSLNVNFEDYARRSYIQEMSEKRHTFYTS